MWWWNGRSCKRGLGDIKLGAAVLPTEQSSGCRGCPSVSLPQHVVGVQLQPTDASTERAAGEAEVASTIPLTVSGALPGAGITAKACPMKARLVAMWEGAPGVPISHGRGPRSAWPPCEGSPYHGISSSPSNCACDYSKSLSAGLVRVAKIELGAGGDPLSSLLTSPGTSTAVLPGSCWAQARLVKAPVNEITSTSPAKAIICFCEAI